MELTLLDCTYVQRARLLVEYHLFKYYNKNIDLGIIDAGGGRAGGFDTGKLLSQQNQAYNPLHYYKFHAVLAE